MPEWTDDELAALDQQMALVSKRPSMVRELLNARRVIEAARPVTNEASESNLGVLRQALQTYDLSREAETS